MPFLETSGLRWHYDRYGHGSEPLLFVHGSFASGRWWLQAVERLDPDRYTSFLLDLRGCGRSSRAGDAAAYRVEQQAADLADFCDGIGLEGFHLIGHSLGAAIALTLATSAAHRLRSLCLVATPSPAGTPSPPEALALLDRMRGDRALLMQALASTMPARPPDLILQQLVDDAFDQAPTAFVANAEALAAWRLPREALGRLRLPVLLVWGDRDQYVDRVVQQELLLAIPGANNLEVLRGCGHSPMLERPEGFAEVLMRFVEQDFDEFAAIRAQAGE